MGMVMCIFCTSVSKLGFIQQIPTNDQITLLLYHQFNQNFLCRCSFCCIFLSIPLNTLKSYNKLIFVIQAIEKYGNKTLNVFVLSLEEYLRKFWQSHIPEVMELYESLTASLETKVKGYQTCQSIYFNGNLLHLKPYPIS